MAESHPHPTGDQRGDTTRERAHDAPILRGASGAYVLKGMRRFGRAGAGRERRAWATWTVLLVVCALLLLSAADPLQGLLAASAPSVSPTPPKPPPKPTTPGDAHPRRVTPNAQGPIVVVPAAGGTDGCTTATLSANDDGSTGAVALPFSPNLFGTSYTQLYVNNNGNVTFDAPQSQYTPSPIIGLNRVIIAPFWADVDTRGTGSGVVTYGTGLYSGRTTFCVNWLNVGYYGAHTDKLNGFQLLLMDRSDVAVGSFDILFNYGSIQWETGDASGGSGGLGGSSARAGYSNGSNTSFEVSGSGNNGAFLDSNPAGLIHTSYGAGGVPGRQVYAVRNGGVAPPTGGLPIPGRPAQARTVGAVTVYAAAFTTTGGGWSASGTVWIGDYTIVETANVTANSGILSGNGLVSMMTTSNGSTRSVLFSDAFVVNTTNGTLTPQASSGYQFRLSSLAGFTVNQSLYQINLDIIKGIVSGSIKLSLVIPNNAAAPKTLAFTLDHMGAVTGTLTDITVFDLGAVSLTISKATLSANGLALTDAALALPTGLGHATAELAAEDARITADGQFILTRGSASVNFPNIRVGSGTQGFGIEGAKVTLTVEAGAYTFHGQGKFRFPGVATSSGACEFGTAFTLATSPPPVREVALSISGCVKIPIGTTGFFVTSVSGTFTMDQSTAAVDLSLGIQGGPDLPIVGSAISGTVNGHWDSSWAIGLSGTLSVFGWQGANANLTLSAKDGLVGSLHLSAFGFFDGDGRIHVWTDGNHFHFTGDANVSVQIPAGIIHGCAFGGILCASFPSSPIPGPTAGVKFGEFHTPGVASVYGLKGQTTVGTWHPAFFIDTSGNRKFDLGGLQQYQLVDQSANALRTQTQSGPNTITTATYPVAVGTTPALIVALPYDSGSPTLTLTDPFGTIITPSTGDPAIYYESTGSQLVYTVANPAPGTWNVIVGNLSGSEHYVVDVVGAPLAAAIPQAPTLVPIANGYAITVQATGAADATYSLFYDTDSSGNDGRPIATHLPISQTQVNWDTRTVPNGTYYVYAILDDTANAPVVAYSASTVDTFDVTPPAVPTNLQVTATGSDLSVTWQASTNVDIAGYHITYQQPAGGQLFVADVPSGLQSSATIHGLTLNGTWWVALSAYDINGNESTTGSAVPVSISAVKTFALSATPGGSAAASPPGVAYAPGTIVTLTATRNVDAVFTGWTVDGAAYGTANPLIFTTTGNHAVVANFAPLPSASSLSPASGSATGGGNVTITGVGFVAPAVVTFGGLQGTTTAISADGTQLTVIPPAHGPGAVEIVVTTPLGISSLSNGYIYGQVGALPTPQPTAPPGGGSSPLPPTRPAPIGIPPTPPLAVPSPRP